MLLAARAKRQRSLPKCALKLRGRVSIRTLTPFSDHGPAELSWPSCILTTCATPTPDSSVLTACVSRSRPAIRFASCSAPTGTRRTGLARPPSATRRSSRWRANTSIRARATSRPSSSTRSRSCTNRGACSSQPRQHSKSPAEGQVVSRAALIIKARGQVDRTEKRVQSEKHAAIGARTAERDVAPIAPHITLLDRGADIDRHVQEPGALVADLAVVDAAQQREIRTDQRVRRETRQIQESAQ